MDREEKGDKKVVIVGGGLVGGLCACVLANKEDFTVELYESRPDPRTPTEKARFQGRSINLALSARGRAALARAGLEDVVLSQGIPMRGRMIHSNDGRMNPILYDPNTQQCIYSVSRQFLNEILIEEAGKKSNVRMKFSHKLVEANLDKGELTFQTGNGKGDPGERVKVGGDLLIGADGAHSALRRSLLKKPMTNFSQTYIDHAYMELRIPPKGNGEHAMPKNYLHIWPRNEFMLIALPNLDGSFTATLFMPIPIFDELNSAAALDAFFTREFPDAFKLIGKQLLVQDFLSSKPSHLISVKCSPLNHGKALLIGDAAHAMVPFYGQGMNSGFEDVLLLDDFLPSGSSPSELPQLLSNFSRERVPNAHAICELALYNYLEMRCLVNQPSFIIRRYLDYKLHKIFGSAWIPLYNNVTFSLTPYSECIAQKERQDQLMNRAKLVSFAGIAVAIPLLGGLLWRNNPSIWNNINWTMDKIQKYFHSISP